MCFLIQNGKENQIKLKKQKQQIGKWRSNEKGNKLLMMIIIIIIIIIIIEEEEEKQKVRNRNVIK